MTINVCTNRQQMDSIILEAKAFIKCSDVFHRNALLLTTNRCEARAKFSSFPLGCALVFRLGNDVVSFFYFIMPTKKDFLELYVYDMFVAVVITFFSSAHF